MPEFWNDGFKVFVKYKRFFSKLLLNIPSFQYSIIPDERDVEKH